MKLLEINRHPPDRQLRQFGLLAAAALPLAAWLWHAGGRGIGLAAAVGLLAAVLAVWRPQSLRAVFVGCNYVTFPVGWVVSELALICLFYGIVLPTGLVLKWVGHDPLRKRFEPGATTYWEARPPAPQAASYFRRW